MSAILFIHDTLNKTNDILFGFFRIFNKNIIKCAIDLPTYFKGRSLFFYRFIMCYKAVPQTVLSRNY